ILLVIAGTWLVFGPATVFDEKSKYIFVRDTGNIKEQVIKQLDTEHIIHFPGVFNLIASGADAWQRIKPGRFEIKKDESIFNIVRTLRNNIQSPVRFTIIKLRLKEDFAKQIEKNFSTDSATAIRFLNNNDSLQQLHVDSNTVFSIIVPDTYL